MTHIACESVKLRSVVKSFVHPCPENSVAIGRAVMYYALAAHAFSVGIKCWHCKYNTKKRNEPKWYRIEMLYIIPNMKTIRSSRFVVDKQESMKNYFRINEKIEFFLNKNIKITSPWWQHCIIYKGNWSTQIHHFTQSKQTY